MSTIPMTSRTAPGTWQANFTALLPAIENQARFRFRRFRRDQREEAIAETVACACHGYQQLAQRGQLDRAFVTTLAGFGARHVAQDRHFGYGQSSRDALSRLAQKRRGFAVHRLPSEPIETGWRAQLVTNKRFTPADAAAFRVDFAAWLGGLNFRDRRVIGKLAAGERTADVAEEFGTTPGRVSQLRRKYERSWCQFQGQTAGKLQPA